MFNKLTIDKDTYATNPGNTKVNPLIWFWHKPITVGLLSMLVIIPVVGFFSYDHTFIGFVAIALVFNYLYWKRIREHFNFGDSNGGIVVSTQPTLVAVTTSLSKGVGYYPVVKIIPCAKLKSVAVGDRIATVALYDAGYEHLPYWDDFHPVPLGYATKDAQILNTAMASYPDEQWQKLANYLQQVKRPYKEGLYKIYGEDSDWDAEDDSDS